MDSNQITYPVTFALRRGLSADLYEVNETLHQGEPVIEIDTLKIKIGDGEHPYNELDYVGASELSTLEIDISKLQEQINTFFADADISTKAIDTLLEIQKILNDSSMDIQELLNKVNEFEALHKELSAELANATADREAIRSKMGAEDQKLALELSNLKESHSADKATIEAHINEVAAAADSKIDETNTAIRADVAVIETTLNKNINEVVTNLTKVDDEIKDSVSNLAATVTNEITNAKLDREAIRNEIKEEKADLIKRSQEDHSAMREDIDEVAAGLDKKIDEVKTTAANALSEEVENRTIAIQNLEDKHSQAIHKLNETVFTLGSEINGLSDDLNIEIERAKTAENTNDLAIKAEVARATEAEKNITDSHAADMEALRKEIQEDVENLSQQINKVNKNQTDANLDLEALIDSSISEIGRTTDYLKNKHEEDIAAVRSEAANDRAKIREELASAKNETQAYADAIKTSILGSDKLNETYDTLTEIAAWIEDHGVEATDLAGAIAAEASTRDAKDVELTNAIEAEKTARESKDIVIETAIANEITNRQNKETEIEKAISDETSARSTETTKLTNDLVAESDRAIQKETEIEDRLTDLNNTTTTKFTSLDEQLVEMNGKINSLPANELEVVKTDLVTHKEEATTKFAEIDESISTATSDRAAIRVEFAAADEEIIETNTTDHTAIRAEFAQADATIITDNNADHEAIRNELAQAISAAQEDRALIRSQYAEADNILSTTCAAENAAIRAEFAEADSEIVEANTADHASIRNELGQAMSIAQSDRALIREQYAAADNALSISCEAENASIRAEFAAADLKVTTSLNEEIARATAAEADVLSQSKAYTDSVKTSILGSEQLESTFNTLTNIAAWIEGDGVNATELTEAIAVETQNRATEDAAIRQSITDLNTAINATINELDIAHKAEIKSTNDTVAALGTELRGVDSNINARLDAAITAHEAEDARIDAAYKAADTYWVNDIDTRYTKAVADMTADYIKRDEDIIAYFDEQLGVIMNGSY